MIVVYYTIALILFVLVVFISFKRKMAALVAWIVGTIVGANAKEEPANDNVKSESSSSQQATSSTSGSTVGNKDKYRSAKVRQRFKKPYEDPSFSTTLKSSIEEVIEETIQETVHTAEPKRKLKTRKLKNIPDKTNNIEDSIGYSFFNVKSSGKSLKTTEDPVKKTNKSVKREPTPIKTEIDDDIGFSFIPVKEKSSKKSNKLEKKNSRELLNSQIRSQKSDDSTQIIEHFQIRTNRKRPDNTSIKKTEYTVENPTKKPLEYRESKKVDAAISYANIVAQNFVETKTADSEDLEKINLIEDHFVASVGESYEESLEFSIVNNIDNNLEQSFDLVQSDQVVNKYSLFETKNEDFLDSVAEIHHEIRSDSIQKESNEIELKEECTTDDKDIIIDHIEQQCKTESKLNLSEETVVEKEDVNKKLNIYTMSQIRILTLNDKEHQESTLYRLENNWIIQFRLGPSLLGRKVNLYCNYPTEDEEFNRTTYHLLNWQQDEGCEYADDTALYTQIVLNIPGSFHYYFTYNNETEKQGSGYFLVDPILKYGNNEDLLLDCIQCQTVLSKNLGSFSTWEKKLRVTKESGYNMVHFTPIQELGASNSCYSLCEQLKLNPVFKKSTGEMPTFDEIFNFTSKLRKEWKLTSICDIVLNHTANESEWLMKHPETTYNCSNCPYLKAAYMLDAALHQFSMCVKKGLYEDKGIPVEVTSEDHLNAIRYHFRQDFLNPLKLDEFFICDVNKLVNEFLLEARKTPPCEWKKTPNDIILIQDPQYQRLKTTVDLKLALELYNIYRLDCFDEEVRFKRCAEEFKKKLDQLNQDKINELNNHLNAAIENTIATIRYFRVQHDGPKLREITIKTPLVYRYFTDYGTPISIEEHENIMFSENGKFLMAHNGWVMNADPLKNFAANDSNVYIRRELIAWGDSVKLRYGDKPEDCPFLWNHMRAYVEQTARIFDGVRLDNCHSTPIHVAEYLLDCARRIKPNLYVVAELFTNSDLTDNIFVNRLGITSLIREAMSAWDSHEEGRLVYRYGGYPVGSFYQPNIRPLVPSIAHALFLDLTHDNPSPIEKRSVYDLLPSTALVNMACCASGSNRGYDELIPHHIHVVDETRQYTEWFDEIKPGCVNNNVGIIAAKKALNDLHFELAKNGFNQVYVDQMDSDIVAVTRHCPKTHQSYILVAFTAFNQPDIHDVQRYIKPLRFEGVLDEIVLEANLTQNEEIDEFIRDSQYINGLTNYHLNLKQHIGINESNVFQETNSHKLNVTQLDFKCFKPGSIVVIKTSLPESMQKAVEKIRNLINQFSLTKSNDLTNIIDKLTLADLNRILYRCQQEEKDEGFNFDTYNIPKFGYLVYAGLQGFMSLLSNIRPNNDLGHPMCENLRDGNWMIDYIWQRLKLDNGTKELGVWIEENTTVFNNNVPRYLVPCYFDMFCTSLYVLVLEQCYKLMSNFVKNGSTFVKSLSLGSVQFCAYIKSATLPTLSPNLSPPKPPTRTLPNGEIVETCVTLSAGLPHFSVGYMRNWGRDTFIALRGLLILTGRYEEARQHILGYAACLRHGLIPNLLDGGRNSRFNCRDAVWWWLYCIKEYCQQTPNGINLLNDKVSRIFPNDDSEPQPAGVCDQPLYETIQETLNIHFQGLVFRERNAGTQIDEQMMDAGFNNQIGVHPETGFVFGGNEWNCGTWMDKMGSSFKAGNKGKPATPRDGSAVEIIGLSKAVITWLSELYANNLYPYDGVERTHKNGTTTKWTFNEWSNKIQNNFEQHFWINTISCDGEFKPHLINKRGIYKDCYGATQEWTDYQLRCNFPIAMVVAPELFDRKHAWIALEQVEKHLMGPLGIKTLDPDDWAYNGDYDNSNDGDNFNLANGFNYHQGPEWLWPVGFYLRAKLYFASLNNLLDETVDKIKVTLSRHFVELQTSDWRGLPELTNANGSYCKDSSRTQAWSMACILEVLEDLQRIESQQPKSN